MYFLLTVFIGPPTTFNPPPVSVADLGSSGVLLGLGVLAIGAVARLIKNKKQ